MGEKGGNNEISPALELNYDDLPFFLKPCFLYLGCFPEDFEIETERLYHLWEAEGLVTQIDARAQARGISLDDIAELYLNELVQRCMVQVVKRSPNGKIESCRLRYDVRVMCLQKCEYVNFLSTINWGILDVRSKKAASSSLGCTKLRRCALYLADNSHDKSISTTSTPVLDEDASIRSLLVFPCGLEDCEVDKLFSKNMMALSLLQVLDLQGSGIKILPRELEECIHLRYLSIRDTVVAEIPRFIVYLKYLETLDLRCENGRDPVKMFGDFQRLESLRHLYLPAKISMDKPDKLRLSADEMETYVNFNMRTCQVEDVVRMSKLRNFTFSHSAIDTGEGLELLLKSPLAKAGCMMTTFKISACVINEKPTVLMAMNEYLKELYVYGKIEAAVDDAGVDIFPHSLTKLELYACDIGKNLFSQIEQLPHLEELELAENAVKGDYMSISNGAFPMLVRLRLQNADVVEIKVGEGAFPNLKKLELWYCGYLEKKPEGLPSSCVIDDVMCYYRELEAQDMDEDDDDNSDAVEEEAASPGPN